jgi:chromosome segregation ATPase
MDFLERLQKAEQKYNENKILIAKLEEKRDNLKAEYESLLAELEAAGVTEQDLGQTITNLNVEIDEKLASCEESLK